MPRNADPLGYKQDFLNALDPRGRRLMLSPRDLRNIALAFVTFTRPLRSEQAADVATKLLYIGVLMPTVAAAELATVHVHQDEHGPALDQAEADKHRRQFTKLRTHYVKDLRRLGVHIDLDGYEHHATNEILDAGDPCRILQAQLDFLRAQPIT